MIKILQKIVILILLFSPFTVFGAVTPIEKVFKDIDSDYKYYDELQTLYDKGMFKPDINGNFNPKKLLTREEFIGITSEVSCKKCIQPNVSYDYFSKYNNSEPFFDIKKENKYFYCIAGAAENKEIEGYYPGDVCENGTSKSGEAPFCPQNTIILEEALAIMLRTSNILSNSSADFIRGEIASGVKFPDLAKDVKAKLLDGGVYSFYPDFREALNYEIFEYDTSGNQKTYKLLEKTGDKLYPKKAVSKEEFLKMSYVLLKGNSCIENNFYNMGLKMKIFNQSCNEKISARCSLSKLRGTNKIFDFLASVDLVPGDKISRKEAYVWRFYNFSTGKEIIKFGRYLDNYDFLENGRYRVFLNVNTDLGYSGEVYNDINIFGNTKKDLKVSIDANPIFGAAPLHVNFKGIISSSVGIASYFWEYGDSETSYGINNSHTYKQDGVYEVKLTVTDLDGNIASASVLVFVYDKNKDTDGDGIPDFEDFDNDTKDKDVDYVCTKYDIKAKKYNCSDGDLGVYNPEKDDRDTDGDGVKDVEDDCPLKPGPKNNNGCPFITDDDTDGDGVPDSQDECPKVPGPARNKGCPEDDDICKKHKDCKDGYVCIDGTCKEPETCEKEDDCKYGLSCLNGECVDGSCEKDLDCPYGYNCIDGTCKEPETCKKNKDCDDGFTCFYGICEIDTDDDDIPDDKDSCPLTPGVIENNGCPIYENPCTKDSDCPKGYSCANGFCKIKEISKNCNYSGLNLFYGNVICDTCPCQSSVDFDTNLKNCDIVFPAITSPDETKIYSKGNYYEINKKP